MKNDRACRNTEADSTAIARAAAVLREPLPDSEPELSREIDRRTARVERILNGGVPPKLALVRG